MIICNHKGKKKSPCKELNMTEAVIKEMHKEAREVIEKMKTLSENGRRIVRNAFKYKWWGIEPEEALRIGGR